MSLSVLLLCIIWGFVLRTTWDYLDKDLVAIFLALALVALGLVICVEVFK